MVDHDMHCYFGGAMGAITGLDVGNGAQYDLHADTRNSRQVTWRKQSVESPWVEGSYDVQAVRGNVTELVAVWVYGNDPSEFRRNLQILVGYLASPSWSMLWTIEGMQELWNCTFSDYTVETQREFQYADTGVVRMNIMRRPRVAITYADTSTFVG